MTSLTRSANIKKTISTKVSVTIVKKRAGRKVNWKFVRCLKSGTDLKLKGWSRLKVCWQLKKKKKVHRNQKTTKQTDPMMKTKMKAHLNVAHVKRFTTLWAG